MHYTLLLVALGSFAFAQTATAQIYKCTDAGGKVAYSQTPCAKANSREDVIDTTPAPPPGSAASTTDWAAESAASNARAAAMNDNSRAPKPAVQDSRPATTTAVPTEQQLVAECEAQRGARCNSPEEIEQRRLQHRQFTPEERQRHQNTVAVRQLRERLEREEMEKRRKAQLGIQ